jgi:3-(3-hydroxy-phenyl)propionate hydroxylase
VGHFIAAESAPQAGPTKRFFPTGVVLSLSYDVALVGLGPTGLVAASLLGQAGWRVAAFEQQLQVYDKPRAISFDHEIARIFQQLGVWEAIEPHTEPFTDSVYYGVDGDIIKRMSTVGPPYPLAHWPSMVFSQPAVEGVLRDHVQGIPGVDCFFGHRAKLVGQDEQGVTLMDEGAEVQIRAHYLIACDGASSGIRQQLALSLKDLHFDEPWLVIDVLVNDSGLAKLPSTSVQYCRPERPASYLICPGRHRRWEIAIHPDEDASALATPEGAWSMLQPWITPEDGTLWRRAAYRFHALVAKRWHQGRAFIAGDAAHQQPPFLGQGMCQGLRDAANLCWKLDAVLRGYASPTLLDTYGSERGGHVEALTTRIKHIGELIGERDTAAARARDKALLEPHGGLVPSTPRQDVQPPLTDGLLATPVHPAQGTLFLQPWLIPDDGTRVRMDDYCGSGWRLVCFGLKRNADLEAQLRALRVTVIDFEDLQLQECDDVISAWLVKFKVAYALIRPDHYVYGVGSDAGGLHRQLGALSEFFFNRE